MRMIAKYSKGDSLRFISHLDIQRLFQRALRRAKLPLAYSQGFNPHPLLSFAAALAVGWTSDGEYLDVVLKESIPPEEFAARMNEALPNGVKIVEAIDAGDARRSLTSLMRSAEYDIELILDDEVEYGILQEALDDMLSGAVNVSKKTKGGIKTVDIRPYVLLMQLKGIRGKSASLRVKAALTASGGLPVELLMNALKDKLGYIGSWIINRSSIEMEWMELK